MKDLYYRNMLEEVWKNKRWIGICVVICVILSGFAGYRKGISVKQEVEAYKQALESFESSLAGYDDSIAVAQAAADEARKQLEEQQKYCDESILMQIDAQNEWVATIQRQIFSLDGSVQNNTLYALIAYVNSGGYIEYLCERIENILQPEYISELVSCTNQGNVITIKIVCPEENIARDLSQVAADIFDERAVELQSRIGEFTLQKYDISVYKMADTVTMNAQTNAKNTLKSLQNSVTDTQNKVISTQTTKDNYYNNNHPEEVQIKSRKIILIQYLALGGIIGFIVAVVGMMVRFMTGVHLHNKEELENAGWEVIGTYDYKTESGSDFNRSILHVTYLNEKNKSKLISLCYLGKSEELMSCVERYKTALEEKGVTVKCIDFLDETVETMEEMLRCNSSVLFTAAGYTKYTDVEQYRGFCEKYSIEMWGCVFVN